MQCQIKYICKERNGHPRYWCLIHKSLVEPNSNECNCQYKHLYDNIIKRKKSDIKDYQIIYPNIFESTIPDVYINNNKIEGLISIDNNLIDPKDYNGILLSKLSNQPLEKVICPRCNNYHTDNGKFAYMPHKIHRCLYCGHDFHIDKPNVGNILDIILTIPYIRLANQTINIDSKCELNYGIGF